MEYIPWNTHTVLVLTSQWRHNERDGVSNHQSRDCLLCRLLIRRRSKKTSKLRVTGLCEGNSPVTGEFPSQRTSNAENVSIWWSWFCFDVAWHRLIISTSFGVTSLWLGNREAYNYPSTHESTNNWLYKPSKMKHNKRENKLHETNCTCTLFIKHVSNTIYTRVCMHNG